MAKVLRISGEVLWTSVELVVFLIIFVAFAIRTFTFQTWLAQQFAHKMEKDLGVEVRIDRVEIIFFDQAKIKGLYMEDLHQDTLIYAGETFAQLSDLTLDPMNLHLSEVNLTDGICKLIKYEGEEDLNIQFLVDYFASEDTTKKPFEMTVDHVQLSNMAFVYQDQNDRQHVSPHAMNYSDLNLRDVNLEAEALHIVDADIDANILHLSARDHSGLDLAEFGGKATYNKEGVELADFFLEMGETEITSGVLGFRTPNGWNDFTNEVIIVAEGIDGRLQMGDLGYFTDALYGGDQVVVFNGNVTGPVNRLVLDGFELNTGSETKLAVSGTLPSWDDLDNAQVDLDIAGFHTTRADLEAFRIPPYSEVNLIPLPEFVGPGSYDLAGTVKGSPDDLAFDVSVSSPLGDVVTNGPFTLKKDQGTGEYAYAGSFDATGVDLRTITGMEDLGTVNASLVVDGYSFAPETMAITASGSIRNVYYKGYTYDLIQLSNAKYRDGFISGRYDVQDPMARLSFDGEISYKGTPNFKAELDIAYFDPVSTNLMESDSAFSLSGEVDLDASGKDLDNVFGTVIAHDFVLNYGQNSIALDSMEFIAQGDEFYKEYKLESSVLDATVAGMFHADDLMASINKQLSEVFPSVFGSYQDSTNINPEDFEYNITFKNVNPLLDIFSPAPAMISPNTTLAGSYNSPTNSLNGTLTFDSLRYDVYALEKGTLTYELKNSALAVDLEAASGRRGAQVFTQLTLSTYSRHDDVSTSLSWGDAGALGYGSFIVDAHLDSLDHITMDLDESVFAVKTEEGLKEFTMSSDAEVEYKGDIVEVRNLKVSHKDAYVMIDGVLGPNLTDRLNLTIHQTPMELIWAFAGTDPGIAGVLEGQGSLYSAFNKPGMDIELEAIDLHAGTYQIGDFLLDVVYNPDSKKMNIENGRLELDGKQLFSVGGWVYPESEEMNVKLAFNNTDLYFLNGLMQDDAISDISGRLNNALDLHGTFSEPILTGSLMLNDVSFRTGVLGAYVRLDGKIQSEQDMIFGELNMYDADSTLAKLNMSLYHRNLTNWNLGVELLMYEEYVGSKGFLIMDKPYKEGEPMEGQAYVKGYVDVSGTFSEMVLEGDITTLEGSDIGILAEEGVVEKENEFLVFVDSTGDIIQDSTVETSFDFGLDMLFTFHVDKKTSFRLVFDKANDDVITVHGDGDPIRLHMKPNGEMDLYGEYVITDGEYPFSFAAFGIPVIIPLGIERGSKVSFSGDPFEPNLDVIATRTVKADFTPLLLSQNPFDPVETTSKRKKKVICKVELKGTLSNMTPELSITSPTANEKESEALATLNANQAELEQQFFHLVALQSFIPAGSGAGLSGTDIAANVLNELVSRSLSGENLDVNLGLGSSGKNEPGQRALDQVEVGLSFNAGDKVKITTNVGVASGDKGSGSQPIFDFILEYRLDEEGNLSITVFNKSKEPSQQEISSFPFLQGVGLKYEVSYLNWDQYYKQKRDRKERGRVSVEEYLEMLEEKNKENKPDEPQPGDDSTPANSNEAVPAEDKKPK